MLLQLFCVVQYTPPLPPPVALLHTKWMTPFHLDVFSSQTLRCCTTTWSSCSPMSYFWRRWRSVPLWRPSSSSATSSRTTNGRKLSWRNSWLLLLAYGSPQRCRGMGHFCELWAGCVVEVMSCPVREYTSHMRVVGCLMTSCALGSHCASRSPAVQKLLTESKYCLLKMARYKLKFKMIEEHFPACSKYLQKMRNKRCFCSSPGEVRKLSSPY